MSDKNTILLTGATGLLGQFLLLELLKSRLPVAVCVRSKRMQDARSRIEALLVRFEGHYGRNLPRPVVLEGDLRGKGCGLGLPEVKWIAENCSSVIHSAASLSFKPADRHPDNEPFKTNVEGTQRLLQLCEKSQIEEFHFVSSSYVCGLRQGRVLESDGWLGQSFSNDYEQSKLQAEGFVRESSFLKSVTVYRPSIIVDLLGGAQQMGDRTIYSGYAIYQLIAKKFGVPAPGELCLRLGLTAQEQKNLVPADWVAQVIVNIVRRPEWHGRTYHLTNPRGLPFSELEEGYRAAVLRERSSQLQALASSTANDELLTISGAFVETFAPYFRDDPQFDLTEIQKVLDACRLPQCPRVTASDIEFLASQQAAGGTSVSGAGNHFMAGLSPQLENSSEIDTLSAQSLVGLSLSGPEGGDYTLCLQGQSCVKPFLTHTAGLDVKMYLTRKAWEELTSGGMSPSEMIQNGALVVEYASGITEQEAKRRVDEIVSAVRLATRNSVSLL